MIPSEESPDWVKNILFWIRNPKSPPDAVDADVETSMAARLPPDFLNFDVRCFFGENLFSGKNLSSEKKTKKKQKRR